MSLPRGQNPFPLKPRNPGGRTVVVSCIFLSLMMGLSVVAGYRMAQQDFRARVITKGGASLELYESKGMYYLTQDPTEREKAQDPGIWNWEYAIGTDGQISQRYRAGG